MGDTRLYAYRPREGWWSSSNQWGQNLDPTSYLRANVLTTGNDYQPPVPGVKQTPPLILQEDGEPTMHTVSLGLAFPNREGSFPTLFGRVEAGAGGGMQSFEVDWQDGTLFSFPLNSLKITPVWELEPDIATTLVVTISLGSRGVGIPAQRAIARNLTVNAGALSTYFRLPPFTKAVRIWPGAQATEGAAVSNAVLVYSATTRLFFVDDNTGAASAAVPGNVFANSECGYVPVPSNARFVRVSNGAGSAITVNLVADLGL